MTRPQAWEAWLCIRFASTEKGGHGFIGAKVDFMQELAIDLAQLQVMLLTFLKGSLSILPTGPLLTIPQAAYPPIVQPPAFALHEL